MCIVYKKQTFQHRYKVVVVFVLAILAIEYNYSIIWSTLNLRESNGNYSIGDAAVANNNVTLAKHKGLIESLDTLTPPPGYLVWNDHCRMPDVNPFNTEAMDLFKKRKYLPCSKELPLTVVMFDINTRTYSLRIDESAKQSLVGSSDDLSCCYQLVLRSGTGQRVDKDFKLGDCVPFSSGHVFPSDIEGVIITCSVNQKIIQKDAHYFVREKLEVRQRLKTFENRKDNERPVSVLLLGIDSMSRFNLRRVMPETTAKLTEDPWFELSGYNKVADNTLPNLMALLTGYNLTTAYSRCKLPEPGGLDNCNIIWDQFRQNGYVTGYSEDETWMSTFDYVVKGFINPPVDYYARPFQLAIENTLNVTELSGMKFCVGLRHTAEYVYDFALEMASRYRSQPYFGLFWTNTFTHNSFSDGSTMDARIAKYIEQMKQGGILDDSIVILFSDHGMRFGDLRKLKQGFIDERLPFIFIWLPNWFRAKHPDFVEALRVNRYRLTNNYDIYMTLQHIIELTGRSPKLPHAVDCPNCQSIFRPVPEQRSCKDIAIDDHWCTCIPYENVDVQKTEVIDGTIAVLQYVNLYLKSIRLSPPCMVLRLHQIEEAQMKVNLETDSRNSSASEIYRIRFTVTPEESNGKFEASFSYSTTKKSYELINSVSRLDSYEKDSRCINDKSAKKYCICD